MGTYKVGQTLYVTEPITFVAEGAPDVHVERFDTVRVCVIPDGVCRHRLPLYYVIRPDGTKLTICSCFLRPARNY